MSGYWRIAAKYETVCARCRGYIKRGAWIVQEHGDWVHAVCPADLHRQSTAPKVPTKYVEYHTDENGNLVEQETTLQ
jgi:hypothetical protein